jgi:hypothetical protein
MVSRKQYGDEGPRKVVIPRQEYLSCSGCKYYDHHMLRSGMHPIYESVCIHPATFTSIPRQLPDMVRDAETPDWCPFRLVQNQVDTVKTEM